MNSEKGGVWLSSHSVLSPQHSVLFNMGAGGPSETPVAASDNARNGLRASPCGGERAA
jgi:hypothetical protein